jgi:hypothetical protein
MNDKENLELEQSKGQFLIYRAENEYDKFHVKRLSTVKNELSDFDKAVERIEASGKKKEKE